MFRPLLLCLFAFATSPVFAQQVCNPTYHVKYGTCVQPNSPVTIQNVTTDWILVNEGARRISDALCTEHIGEIAKQNPKATNIQVKEMKDEDAFWRGLGKRDVYCKFTMDSPVQTAIQSRECGIDAVEREGCVTGLTVEFAQSCLKMPTGTTEELWQKAGCLVDVYEQAPRIVGLDQATYDNVEFSLRLIRDRFDDSSQADERRLSSWVKSKLPAESRIPMIRFK